MRIAIVVQGRFHAFDLARALDRRGHDVTVFTNYPGWAVERFGWSPSRTRNFVSHALVSRVVDRVNWAPLSGRWEPMAHRRFGRWAANELARESWDVIHCWSGISEEILSAASGGHALTLLMRGSSHVRTQRRLLDEESARAETTLDRPSDWMVARELREYELADRIVVLSAFSWNSFVDEGISEDRLDLLTLGTDVSAFAGSSETTNTRAERIRRGDPLHVLYVGALSYRKGLLDLANVARGLPADRFRFTLVGNCLPECRQLVASLPSNVAVAGRVPQSDLPASYRLGDVFLFPTIEDGFPVVLAQAKAAGLPIITTPNGAGSDIVRSPSDGWIVPIRDSRAIVERLTWCDRNRERLAEMATTGHAPVHSRDWSDVAIDLEGICARDRRRVGVSA